ncbi:BMP family ABC transporter substrate-binding protein [Sandaracinus amylolyticus]|uniref:BMP family ABC transporter substrate-binding protein n=1 Tax=Sandaracinus amylolyticus TaxID=927083 RepID=UPI001F1F2F8D|nr:BMP family ABC transporter substrate-binding protein [Sandaracinus amylolyticus]UJR84681.1 Hypothetical protein I5071_67600 [Sandaracinus amylolyticus]
MNRPFSHTLVTGALLALATPGCSLILDPQIDEGGGPPPIEGTIDVGFLYVGPVGDHGWTKTHDDARLYLEENVDDVATHYSPTVAVSDAARVIDEFVARGDDVIVGTSYDFLVPIQAAALRHPDRRFLICSGFQTGPNLGSYFGRMELALYQAGVLAGRMTRGDRIGLVGPVVIPESVRHMNAFTRGVRSVNPDARVLVRWTYAWFDPEEETAATEELVAAGADVIFGQTDTPVPIQVSAELNALDEGPVYSIGYDNPDSCQFAPSRCLTSAYWNWGPMITRIVSEMRDGTWEPAEPIYEQMKPDPSESVVYLAPFDPTGPVPTAVRLEIEGLVSELTADSEESRHYPFRGPVEDNRGTTRVQSGAVPTDADLLNMCWFVEGIYELDGTTPAVVPAVCPGVR